MTYSCAYFQHPEQDLEAAQAAKYDLLCKKLRLNAGDHVLEIGSGWGGFCVHAAKTYGCRVTTVTISEEQYRFAQQRIIDEGLTDRITIELKDYRHLTGKFTKIASIEMLEAVGDEFLETYFAQCSRLLTADGLLGIQVITCPDARFKHMKQGVDFVQKHIFPGSLLPSVARINQAVNRTSDLCLLGLEDMAHFYAKTLQIWGHRFQAQLDEVLALGFGRSFIRKWSYYLGYCESAFAARNISVVQMIYTRPNNLTLARSLDPDLP
jgi:cyclopropane-fatty-acyl-phospholipid synthase